MKSLLVKIQDLPELVSDKQLIKIGLFRSHYDARQMRKTKAIEYMVLKPGGTRYLKESVLKFVEAALKRDS